MAFRLLLGLGLSNFFDRAGVESAQFGSDGFGGRGGDGLLRAVMVGLVVREPCWEIGYFGEGPAVV